MSIADAAAALKTAVLTVEDVRVYALGEQVTPPGVVIGPPALTGQTVCAGPTDATFSVYVIVALDDRALERLWELVPAVWAAIEENTDAVVLRADPGTYAAAGIPAEMPSYELAVEHPI